MSCGCRSSGECSHLARQEWNEMTATSRLVVYARRRAMENLLHVVNWHVNNGARLPQEVVDAIKGVEDSTRRPDEGPAAISLPTL